MASELIQLLEREAKAERERILAEARERADRIRHEAEVEATTLVEAQRRRRLTATLKVTTGSPSGV